MLLSQRLIHTRVYGQAIAIFTTVAVMGWAETMEGPYRISNGVVTQSPPHKDASLRGFYEQAGPSKKDKRQSEQEVASSGPSYDLLVPLLYAPLLPLMIVGLRGRVSKDRLTQIVGGTIFVALCHAGTIMFSDRTITMQ